MAGWRMRGVVGVLVVVVGGAVGYGLSGAHHASGATVSPTGDVVFFDDFSGPSLDTTRWNVEVTSRDNRTYSDEQQAYVDSPRTLYIDHDDAATGAVNGALALHARFEPGQHVVNYPEGDRSYDFVSARINTRHKFEVTHGSVSARMKLPALPGTWPAFWTLGANVATWPACGEIDVMENVGAPNWTSAGTHSLGSNGKEYTNGTRFTDPALNVAGWHVYRVDWSAGGFTFFVDDRPVYQVSRAMMQLAAPWVFDAPQHLLLNMAIGGVYPDILRKPGETWPYKGVPQSTVDAIRQGNVRTLVDWVRIVRPRTAAGRIEAESADKLNGIVVGYTSDGGPGQTTGSIARGDSMEFNLVDFSTGTTGVHVRMAAHPPAGQTGTVEFRLDSPTAAPFVTAPVHDTGDWGTYLTVDAPVPTRVAGIHKLYVTFASAQPWEFVNVNWFAFDPPPG